MYAITATPTAPSAPPVVNYTMQVSYVKSIALYWAVPPRENQNGVIRGYTVVIQAVDTGGTVIFNTTHLMMTVEDLLPFRNYVYRIAAYTLAGLGPFSTDYWIQTLQAGRSHN